MSWHDKYGLTWQEEWKLFCDTMNSLSLPEPEQGEDLWDYRDRVEEMFENIELPPPFEGDLFNFTSCEEFAEYLRKYRNIHIQEEIKHTLWRK